MQSPVAVQKHCISTCCKQLCHDKLLGSTVGCSGESALVKEPRRPARWNPMLRSLASIKVPPACTGC